jgi:hypothetical protein
MLRKITLALSAVLVLGAASAASAQEDFWIVTTDVYANTANVGQGLDAFGSVETPYGSTINDPRNDASQW